MAIILVSLGVFLCIFGLAGFASVIYFGFQARKQTEINSKDSKKKYLREPNNYKLSCYLFVCFRPNYFNYRDAFKLGASALQLL